MKRLVTVLLLLLPTLMLAQLDFSLNDWGRLRLIDPAGTRQLDRLSFDFGVDENNVYMYRDVGITLAFLPPAPVTPTVADSEMVLTICYFNGADTIAYVDHHYYWWETKNFLIMSYEVRDNTGGDIPAYFSLDVIPQIDAAYGDEVCDYDAANEMGYVFKPTSYVGVKTLSHPIYSYRSVFYSDYSQGSTFPDTALWRQMTTATSSAYPFSPGSDGSANFLNFGQFTVPANGSYIVYAAVAFANSLTDLQSVIVDAQNTYNDLFTGITPQAGNLPEDFLLGANYPNPFNPSTTIPFALASGGEVRLEVFNLLGQKVRTLLSERREAGSHTAVWNGRDERGRQLESGIYFYRLQLDGVPGQVRKMLLTK